MPQHYFKKSLLTAAIAPTIIGAGSILFAANADTTIVSDGKSTFSIVIPHETSTDVKLAAEELQRDIKLSTGAELPIVNDSEKVLLPVISLGMTKQAKAENLSTDGMEEEQYRIRTKSGSLYIWGIDTPDGKWSKLGGRSNSTANGTYTFLEDYLNVRWLMPGEIGRDVPKKSTFTVDDINRNEKPLFNLRDVNHMASGLQGRAYDESTTWIRRMRAGTTTAANANAPQNLYSIAHSWTATVPASEYEKHPDWFPMIDGKRVPPKGRYMLETTNPGLVEYFGKKAANVLKTNDERGNRPRKYSLVPSDSRLGFSQSPESQALYDPPTLGSLGKPSMTSLILKFYQDVSAVVAREYPEGMTSGLFYSVYMDPPTKTAIKIPDNFFPMVAPSSYTYGYRLYQKDKQEEFTKIMSFWGNQPAKMGWYYYDLPATLLVQNESEDYEGNAANVIPAAPDIMNLVFRTLKDNHYKGGYIYGKKSWSSSALSNYIIAKMFWDPSLDAHQLQREWLERAYGAKAGAKMEQFYIKLDEAFKKYSDKTMINYRLTEDILRKIYGENYVELEKLFLEAQAEPMTEIQAQRLDMIRQNLALLQWRLRNFGLLKADFKSPLQITNAQVSELLIANNVQFDKDTQIDYFPGVIPTTATADANIAQLKVKKVLLQEQIKPAKSEILSNERSLYFYAAKDGKVTITPSRVTHGKTFATYIISDQRRNQVISGLLIDNQPIAFDAKAGQRYYMYITDRKGTSYQLQVTGAVPTKSTFDPKSGALSLENTGANVYIYSDSAPDSVSENGAVYSTLSPSDKLAQGYLDARIVALSGEWKFNPNGITDIAPAAANLDDSSWKTVRTGSQWNLQGYDYHGTAWYRKTAKIPTLKAGEKAILKFTGIDGHATIYVNGNPVGSHSAGTQNDGFKGWNEPFDIDITKAVKAGNNVFAIMITSKNTDTASGIQGDVDLVVGTPDPALAAD